MSLFVFFFTMIFHFAIYPREKKKKKKLVWRSFIYPFHLHSCPLLYLVLSTLPTHQSVHSGPQEEGRGQVTTIRTMGFYCSTPISECSSSNPGHFDSSAVLKRHFTIPSSELSKCYYLSFLPLAALHILLSTPPFCTLQQIQKPT